MKKKYIIFSLGLAMFLSLCGCGEEKAETTTALAESNEQTIVETVATESTVELIEEKDLNLEEFGILDDETLNALITEGLDYLHGTNGKEIDVTKALENFEKAAASDSEDAAFLAGYIYEFVLDENTGRDYLKAREYYEFSEYTNPCSMCLLGLFDAIGINSDGVSGSVEYGLSTIQDTLAHIKPELLLEDESTQYKAEALAVFGWFYDKKLNLDNISTQSLQDAFSTSGLYDAVEAGNINSINIHEITFLSDDVTADNSEEIASSEDYAKKFYTLGAQLGDSVSQKYCEENQITY